MIRMFLETCSTWVSRMNGTNACIFWHWTTEWTSLDV
jgi:hypothetical protein